LLITEGLAVDEAGTVVQVLQLCVHLDQIQTDSVKAWQSAAQFLSTVREAIEGSREDALAGEIQAPVHATNGPLLPQSIDSSNSRSLRNSSNRSSPDIV
jgi:hypothetical protein